MIRQRALHKSHEDRTATSDPVQSFTANLTKSVKNKKNKRDYQRRGRLDNESVLRQVAAILSEGDATLALDIATTVAGIVDTIDTDLPTQEAAEYINAEDESIDTQDAMEYVLSSACDILRDKGYLQGKQKTEDGTSMETDDSDDEEENGTRMDMDDNKEEDGTRMDVDADDGTEDTTKYIKSVNNLVNGGYLSGKGVNAKYTAALLLHSEYVIKRAKEGKSKHGIRYSTHVWSAAVQILRVCKPQGYDFLRTILPLPHRRNITKYSSIPTPDQGIDDTSIKLLRTKLDNLSDACIVDGKIVLVAVAIDAASLSNRCYLDRNTGRVVGFADESLDLRNILNGFDREFFDKKDLAKYVNIVMVCSLGATREAFPVGAYISSTMTADTLVTIVDETIAALAHHDIAVGIVTADGASENRLMMQRKMNVTIATIRAEIVTRHGANSAQPVPPMASEIDENNAFVAMRHPYYENIFVFFNSDPPHLLKKLRNAVLSSGVRSNANSFTRHLEHNGKYISITDWRDVWKRDHDLGEISSSGVLRSYVYPDNWMKMRVSAAYHVFSPKFQNVVESYNRPTNEDGKYDSLLLYMEHVLGIWDAINTKVPLHGESQQWTDLMPHFQWFLQWKASCTNTADGTKNPYIPSEFIPAQCWYDLQLTCTSLPLFTALYFPASTSLSKRLHIRHTDQDIVEGFFGKARGKSCDRNMDARLVMSVVRDQQIASTAGASANANISRRMVIVEALKRCK